jgi:hypothetical protein
MCKKNDSHGSVLYLYLYLMRRTVTFLITWVWFSLMLTAQASYLDKPELMSLADSCLRHTYNWSFGIARDFQQQLQQATPGHPAPFFLEALIIYWEHFPLSPDDQASDQFIRLMDESITTAGLLMQHESTYLEGVFFDLFGRAFKAMFWADNNRSGKVIPDLLPMYKQTLEGFELKQKFSEFYFSTGLYNYYIEVYPEAHPVYKPLVSFMRGGNRKEGLEQLSHAIHHATYLRVEALLFMSLIQLNYEGDLNTAAIYAERLHMEYPDNVYYQGHLVTILLHLYRYEQVNRIMEQMTDRKDHYSHMIRALSDGFMAEKCKDNDTAAGRYYQRVIDLALSMGPIADSYRAMGYMGLSRIHAKKQEDSEARRYARKASNLTTYRFILDEQ